MRPSSKIAWVWESDLVSAALEEISSRPGRWRGSLTCSSYSDAITARSRCRGKQAPYRGCGLVLIHLGQLRLLCCSCAEVLGNSYSSLNIS